MNITCPSCKRTYRLDEKLIKAPYQKMRCSRCGHAFVYEQYVPKGSEEGPPVNLPRPDLSAGPKKSRKGLIILVVSLLVLLGLAAAFYFYWMNTLGAGERWLSIKKAEGQETLVKDGRVFFVKGFIFNGSTKPRKYVILKAKLYDREGGVMREHFALAGLPLSIEDLQEMRKSDIEGKISEFRLSGLTTFVLQKDKELPFSIIFPDSNGGKVKEFTVEIAEAPSL